MAIAAVGASPLVPATVRAQSLQDQVVEGQGLAGPATTGWNVTLGGGVAGEPIYQGASDYKARPFPLVSVSYDNLVLLDARGLVVNVINWNGFKAGPILGREGGRSDSDSPQLAGMGNISPSLTGGGFVSYRMGPFLISGLVRQAITHSGNGLDGALLLDYVRPLIPGKLFVFAGPDLGFANGRYEQTRFGVTSSQSVSSGLPVYTPRGGLTDVGAHMSLTYRYSDHILIRGFALISELTGDASKGPIVQSKTQGRLGTAIAYHF